MKILLIHNVYQEPGGEDVAFRAEAELLRANAHEVITYTRDNDEISGNSPAENALLAIKTLWAWDSARELREIMRKERPQIAHFHNTFPLISPAAYWTCRELGVPGVQTLHNYRLLCPAATFFRDGHICEECVTQSLLRSVRHGCYRRSRAATAVPAAMLALHSAIGTWQNCVDQYIALTEFSRQKFIQCGFPAEKISVKPNFVVRNCRPRQECRGYALYVGRLSGEKGISTLLKAWEGLSVAKLLKIAGDGPLKDIVRSYTKRSIDYVGAVNRNTATEMLLGAEFLIVPSECYETFGLVVIEAFACGVPVIASRIGAIAEIVQNGLTGLHFTPGDADDLAAKIEWAWTHPCEMEEMGRNARAEYEKKYTAESNYEALIQIYARVQNPGNSE